MPGVQQPRGSILVAEAVDPQGWHQVHDDHSDCQALRKPFNQQDFAKVLIDVFMYCKRFCYSWKIFFSHEMQICSRIGDLKRQKMVRTINIYYNNRSVQVRHLFRLKKNKRFLFSFVSLLMCNFYNWCNKISYLFKGRCWTQEQAYDVAQGQEGLSNSRTNGHQDRVPTSDCGL